MAKGAVFVFLHLVIVISMAASSCQIQRSYFDVLGICCSSEVPLVQNIVNSLPGVKECSVIITTRTVIVLHDARIVSPLQIVKALNQARLEANVRVSGSGIDHKKKWPSPYAVGSGVLLVISLFGYLYRPLLWVALGAVAVGILPILLKGIASLRKLRFDITILALVAVIGTVVLKDYVEAATVVFLFSIAEWLEARASHKAQAVMSSLMSLTPQKAVIAETGEEVDVDVVKLNTLLAVKPGEVIPIDGIVVNGKCEVDEKTLTGESFPVMKDIGSTVYAGTLNIDGYIKLKTTALAGDCVVANMTKLVEEAQNSKSRTQRFIDKCAQYYTPAVIIISLGVAIVPLAFRVRNMHHWYRLALVVLVSACPCALILSTPVATFCALTRAATAGMLIKGGEYLETLGKVRIMAFDKTGTLTRGEFIVNDFEPLSHDVSHDTLLYWIASIESKSSHPMAIALVDYAHSCSIVSKPEMVDNFQNFPGEGIYGKIDGKDIYIGNKKIATRAGSETVPDSEFRTKGQTNGFMYCDGEVVAAFSLSDMCRTGVKETLTELRKMKIKTAMLTGDNLSSAMRAQEEINSALTMVHAELLPDEKAKIIKSFQKEGTTAMIGDGINDAPALATADIGISMGISGSALATETGEVILMTNDLRRLPKMIKLARKANRKVIENVALSMITKGGILALAIAGHPLVWAAVLADVGTCLVVIMNSMLLLKGSENYDGKRCNASHNSRKNTKYFSGLHKSCCSPKGGCADEIQESCCSKSTEFKCLPMLDKRNELSMCCKPDNDLLSYQMIRKSGCSDHPVSLIDQEDHATGIEKCGASDQAKCTASGCHNVKVSASRAVKNCGHVSVAGEGKLQADAIPLSTICRSGHGHDHDHSAEKDFCDQRSSLQIFVTNGKSIQSHTKEGCCDKPSNIQGTRDLPKCCKGNQSQATKMDFCDMPSNIQATDDIPKCCSGKTIQSQDPRKDCCDKNANVKESDDHPKCSKDKSTQPQVAKESCCNQRSSFHVTSGKPMCCQGKSNQVQISAGDCCDQLSNLQVTSDRNCCKGKSAQIQATQDSLPVMLPLEQKLGTCSNYAKKCCNQPGHTSTKDSLPVPLPLEQEIGTFSRSNYAKKCCNQPGHTSTCGDVGDLTEIVIE